MWNHKCNYCNNEVSGNENDPWVSFKFPPLLRTDEFGELYNIYNNRKSNYFHKKCFYNNFIFRDIIRPNCLCGKCVGRLGGKELIRIYISIGTLNLFSEDTTTYEYSLHLDCFNKYWMLNPDGQPNK